MGDKGGKGEDTELTWDAALFLTGTVEMSVRYLGKKTPREWAPQDQRRPGEGAEQNPLPEGESTNRGYV